MLAFAWKKVKCMQIFGNLTFALALVRDKGKARLEIPKWVPKIIPKTFREVQSKYSRGSKNHDKV